ncbi:cysteine hydrolase family protein [Cryptosporangium phraense]|uniref:Cysteine hydrolase n=1 Tax=Cryptosporangium phraense TaxID=2593070 RepID=A0A545ATM5_9ACTN|nr:cysteine hydrolase [Cryptosporangium phraense]TQS44663.1 cysteine hydrolase [Cryptosporangium phraense]
MPVSVVDENVALVVIDLQKGTVGRAGLTPLSGAEVVANTVRLADAFRAAGKPVVLVRMLAGAAPGRTEFGSGGQEYPADWDELVPELTGPELTGDVTVAKRTLSAFTATELDLVLRRRGVTQVVFAGVATSIGVESSARGAYDLGYHVVVATDAVTDLRPDTHALSVGWFARMVGETGTVDEIAALLR